eukprot:SAG11_NODE_2893_length_2860_cov_8.281420_5_plen_64_part_01
MRSSSSPAIGSLWVRTLVAASPSCFNTFRPTVLVAWVSLGRAVAVVGVGRARAAAAAGRPPCRA